jgi:hypothetical protein
MWTEADSLFESEDSHRALRRGLKLVRGMRRALTEDEPHKIASVIAEHLRESNWKIEAGIPAEGHGQHLIPK